MTSTWSVVALGGAALILLLFFHWYERKTVSAREVALVATLAGLAGLSRLPFAAVPGLQPTTFLVLIAGFVFGPGIGFAVGALAALVSNLFLGQGPWTLWQMVGWGLAGASAGWVERIRRGRSFPRYFMGAMAFVWGFLFGWILNAWHWVTFVYPLTWQSFVAVQLAAVGWDALHATGNLMFIVFLGPDLVRILQRFRRRLVFIHHS